MNVYIVGVPTSGKSTLAKILKQEIPEFNVVSFEAVRNGWMKVEPELDMGNRESRGRKEILPGFMVEFARWNAKMTGGPTLVEGSFASVEEVMKLLAEDNEERNMVICLGYGGMKLEEVAKCAIAKANAESYLQGRTEEEFKRHFYDLEDSDRKNQEFCEKYDVPYFVTVENREERLREIVEKVQRELGQSK